MRKSANFSVPGSGKTSSVLGVFAYLKCKGKVDRIVMVGPLNTFDTWKDEFKKTFEEKVVLETYDSRMNSNRKLDVLRYETGSKNLFLFNYEGLNDDVIQVLNDSIINDRTLLVYDEVHRVKSINGAYAKQALRLRDNPRYIVVMTGTPIPNSYVDIVNFLHILYDDEYDVFFNFNPSFLNNPSQSTIDDINVRIRPFFCRTTKNQLMVPPVNKDSIYVVPASPSENDLFNLLSDEYFDNPLARIIRILQLESDPRLLLKDSDELGSDMFGTDVGELHPLVRYGEKIKEVGYTTKTLRCRDIIQNLVRQGKKVIVWCIFIRSIENIHSLLEKEGIESCIIYGSTTEDEKQSNLESFRSGECMVLITNPHTLAESVSLHKSCHDAVYFECSYNLVHLLQSKDRIHRLGLEEGQYTQYHYLFSRFDKKGLEVSLDKEIYTRLTEKEKIMVDAIEADILELPLSTDEDYSLLLKEMGL